MILNKLINPTGELKGIGDHYSEIFSRCNIKTAGDLLEYFPRKFSDRTKLVTLKDALELESATLKVRVIDHKMLGKKWHEFLKVIIHDGDNFGALICFNRNFLKNSLLIDREYFVTGKFTYNFG
jgi:ATP-dependent DNA helicase RecG